MLGVIATSALRPLQEAMNLNVGISPAFSGSYLITRIMTFCSDMLNSRVVPLPSAAARGASIGRYAAKKISAERD